MAFLLAFSALFTICWTNLCILWHHIFVFFDITSLTSVYSSTESAFLVFFIFSSFTGTFWILLISIYVLLIEFFFLFTFPISFSWRISCSCFFVTSSALHISIALCKLRFDPFRSSASLTWFDSVPSTPLHSISPSLMSWNSQVDDKFLNSLM